MHVFKREGLVSITVSLRISVIAGNAGSKWAS
jgi:hypothetical protein